MVLFLSGLISVILVSLFYSFMNSMDTTIPQHQGQTEKMLNHKVSDLWAFSVNGQKS